MNGRQAAKAAAKHIENLEDFNRKASKDIKAYNQCIIHMICGGSPCDFCEENRLNECESSEKGKKGCDSWWLMDMADPLPVTEITMELEPVECATGEAQ